MPVNNIVIGQKVSSEMRERVKELRRAMTPEEMILWKQLRTNKFNGLHFRRQQIIDGYIADFYCHACALIVEVDGGIHEAQVDYDAERDAHLAARGFRILRVTNEEINRNLSLVLRKILDACIR